MKRTWNLLASLLGLAVVGAVVVSLVLIFRSQSNQPAPQQPSSRATAMVVNPLPTLLPATPTAAPYPLPATPTPIEATPIPPATVTPPLPAPTLVPISVPSEILAGEKIAFVRDKDLQIINVASRALVPATASGNVTTLFGWSWDSSKVLLGVGERPLIPETEDPGGMDLWVMNADGTNALQLTEGLEVVQAAWSPVSNQIAYGTRNLDIYIINGDGMGRIKLLTSSYLGPWSPDGSRIVYRELASDYSTISLSVLNIADGSRRQLTSEPVHFVGYLYSLDVQWSLDGQTILFRSYRGEPEASTWWKIDVNNGQLTHLDNQTLRSIRASSGFAPRSPAADQIVFSEYDPTFNIVMWIMDFNGNVREVTRGWALAWSPNGNNIAYVGEDNGLWAINPDGIGATKLADVAECSPRSCSLHFWSR